MRELALFLQMPEAACRIRCVSIGSGPHRAAQLVVFLQRLTACDSSSSLSVATNFCVEEEAVQGFLFEFPKNRRTTWYLADVFH